MYVSVEQLIAFIEESTEEIELVVPDDDFYSPGYKNSSFEIINPSTLLIFLKEMTTNE